MNSHKSLDSMDATAMPKQSPTEQRNCRLFKHLEAAVICLYGRTQADWPSSAKLVVFGQGYV